MEAESYASGTLSFPGRKAQNISGEVREFPRTSHQYPYQMIPLCVRTRNIKKKAGRTYKYKYRVQCRIVEYAEQTRSARNVQETTKTNVR
ncbi:hypothetical protein SCLCIDRAFT_906169 [Scleroderma citrinum Foug A]|uniref:Uncharacterized protein n=1 Tax=Scleroderma citrinum Foug A TaxID=1036808 RepID=A0A0C3AVG8_9AGAM|nr:hypothetical protein SCLCIDRAFT_906169 [Scleroderma citrinum Foug A]